MRRFWSFSPLFLFLVSSCLIAVEEGIPTQFLIKDEATIPVFTPALADRQTAKLRLRNGLEAYLISNPDADKSAAALCVGVGSWEDPADAPGMAHFVEHMLFLGTAKFPEESGFDHFVGTHGGESNAGTSDDRTCFYFSVDSNAFPEALERFSSFFEAPLFNASGVAREINAIDQEFALDRSDDTFRWWQVLKELGNPGHPFHRFAIGNHLTLEGVSRERLIAWYQAHYSADLMRLVVVSPLKLAELEQLVVKSFSEIPTNHHEAYASTEPLTDAQLRGTNSWIEPIKRERALLLFWELPAEFATSIDTKPDQLVSYVLGYEGRRSLIAELKKEGLANGIDCEGEKLGPDRFVFMVKISLTKAGLSNLDTVTERCLQAIALLRRKGIPPSLFDDVQQMERLHYQYQMSKKSFDLVGKYAPMMFDEPLASFPEKNFIVQRYDPDQIQRFISQLTPEHMHLLVLAAPKETSVLSDRKERWMGVEYTVKPIPEEKLTRWRNLQPHADIDLPVPNPYIPRDLLSARPEKRPAEAFEMPMPRRIADDSYGQVYFAHDTYYGVPMVTCALRILTPAVSRGDPTKLVLADLYVKSAKEALRDILYDAEMAGIDVKIERLDFGIGVTLTGYSENALLLWRQLLERLRTIQPEQAQFRTYKEQLLLDYTNFDHEPALMQALDGMRTLLYRQFVSEREKAKAIRAVDYPQFMEATKRLFERCYGQLLVYGSLSEPEAQTVWRTVRQQLGGEPYPPAEHEKLEVAEIPDTPSPVYVDIKSKAHSNAVILAIQDFPFSFSAFAVQQVLTQALKAPFFDALRTQQQTGYSVLNWQQEIERHLFSFFTIVTASHSGRDVLARFELFLEAFLQELSSAVPQGDFNSLRDALVVELEKSPEDLEEMGKLLSQLAFDRDGDFKWRAEQTAALRALSYADFLEGTRAVLGKQNHRRVAVVLRGEFPHEHILEYRKAKNLSSVKESWKYEPRDQ